MARQKVGKYEVEIGADTSGLKSNLQGLPKIIGAAFAADALIGFQKKIIAVQAEFQRYEAVLSNTLGSSLKAQVALKDITKIAASTPFQVNNLTDAYVRLANQGFIPTQKEIIKLGDLASSTGKDFLQLTEAIIDAQVGEFERLKEFGIRASKSGDQVSFTFKGVETQVQFTESAIREYLLSLGELEGVSGAMAKISETTGGKISNLEDNITSLTKALGDSEAGLISSVLDAANYLTSSLAESINAVNTVAKKTEAGGLKAFGMQLLALVNPVYDTQLKIIAKRFDEIDREAAEAEETAQKTSEAEKARQKAIKEAVEAKQKRMRESYEEAIKFSQQFSQQLQIELDLFLGYAQVTERFTKRIQDSMQGQDVKIQDFKIDLGESAPITETADVFTQETTKMQEAIWSLLEDTSTLENAFTGLGTAIVSNMEGGSTALKAFISTFISAAGQYIAKSIAMSIVDKKKAAGKMVNIAAQTAESTGPLAAVVFPAILSGLLALISGVFGGGVSGGRGGGGGVGPQNEATTFMGMQANSSLRDSLNLSGVLEVKNGDKLSVMIKNQDLKKNKT